MRYLNYDEITGSILGFFDDKIEEHVKNDIGEKSIKVDISLINKINSQIEDYVIKVPDLSNFDMSQVMNETYFETYFEPKNLIKDPTVLLQKIKNDKIEELNKACENHIIKGFWSSATGNPHFYRFNKTEDQLNFNQQATMLIIDPNINTVQWKTEDAGIIPHTRNQFMKVLNDVAEFKQNTISEYWQLKYRVMTATTANEIANIVWIDE
ncbi:MAG TPA: hypothetical protein VK190_03025 [Pseudoneobacillus sp.]|jgi:hypothetical protein|nr:hypothetical protein [Pseudoneobacillus sp.]